MYLDVVDLRNFYGGALGAFVRQVLRAKLTDMWPRVAGDRVLGLGYATPFLRPFLGAAERVVAFMPARQGVVNWPGEGPSATALVEETALPKARILEIDTTGLERFDRELLSALAIKFGGGPVGLSTLAVALGEEPETIEDVYEPYLLQLGFLQRTPRGRVITELGRDQIGVFRDTSGSLF